MRHITFDLDVIIEPLYAAGSSGEVFCALFNLR
jgi:hypothetical protein